MSQKIDGNLQVPQALRSVTTPANKPGVSTDAAARPVEAADSLRLTGEATNLQVRRNQTVLVLNRGIGTGETLTAADITTAQRDAARIAGAVLADPNAAIGRIARRPLQAGALLSNNDLVVQRLIKRGDNVALVSRRGSVEVRIAGRAMGDAGENERVSVENLSSRRIVQGTVDAAGDVIVAR